MKKLVKKIIDKPYLIIFLLYFAIIITLTILYDVFPIMIKWSIFSEEQFYSGLITNMYNSLIDLLIITYLFYLFSEKKEKHSRIQHLNDNIEDSRYWFSDEAAYKNSSNVRKLQKLGVKKIDLSKSALFNQIMKALNLEDSKLMGAKLHKSNIEKSNFTHCDFQGSMINDAIVRNTLFLECNLRYVDFSNSNMKSSNISNSILIQVNFNNTNLEASKLRNCDFRNASFKNANLERVDLRGAKNLTKEQLLSCRSIKYAYLDQEFLKDNEICQIVKKNPPRSNT